MYRTTLSVRRWPAAAVAALAVTAAVVLPTGAADAALLPSGDYLWATTATETVVYDRSGDALVVAGSIANAPRGAPSLGPDGSRVYVPTTSGVALFVGGSTTPIGALTNDPGNPGGMSQVGATATEIFALWENGATITRYNVDSGLQAGQIVVPGAASSIAVNPAGGTVAVHYRPTASSDVVSALADGSTGALSAPFRSSTSPVAGSVWTADGRYLLVAEEGDVTHDGGIGVLDAQSGSYAFSPIAGFTPRGIALDPQRQNLFVAADVEGSTLTAVLEADLAELLTGTLTVDTTYETADNGALGAPVITADDIFLPSAKTDVAGDPPGITRIPFGAQPLSVLSTSEPVLGLAAASAANRFVGFGSGQTAFLEEDFPDPIVAVVEDRNGVGIPGVPVTISLAGEAFFPGGATFVEGETDIAGRITVYPVQAGDTAGTVTITATSPGFDDVQYVLTVTGPPTPPGAPTIDTLGYGDGSTPVGFTPGIAGSTPTVEYLVIATNVTDPAAPQGSALGTGSPITVPGLTSGDTYQFTVTAIAQDGLATESAPSALFNVGIPASVSVLPPRATVGEAYEFTFTLEGAPAPTLTFESGALPAGLTYDSDLLTISGTPTAAGSSLLLFSVSNAVANDVQVPIDFIVDPARLTDRGEDPGDPRPDGAGDLARTGAGPRGAAIVSAVSLLGVGGALFLARVLVGARARRRETRELRTEH